MLHIQGPLYQRPFVSGKLGEFQSAVCCAGQGPVKGQPSHSDSKREHLIQRGINSHRALESEGVNYSEVEVTPGHLGMAGVRGSLALLP